MRQKSVYETRVYSEVGVPIPIFTGQPYGCLARATIIRVSAVCANEKRYLSEFIHYWEFGTPIPVADFAAARGVYYVGMCTVSGFFRQFSFLRDVLEIHVNEKKYQEL